MLMKAEIGDKSYAIGNLLNASLLFYYLQGRVDFIILEHISFEIIIGRPKLRRICRVLDFNAEDTEWIIMFRRQLFKCWLKIHKTGSRLVDLIASTSWWTLQTNVLL